MLAKHKCLVVGLFTIVVVFLLKYKGTKSPLTDNLQDANHLHNVEPTHVSLKKAYPYVEPDKTKRFGIIRNVFEPTEPAHEHDVTIVTHMDPSRIRNAENLANTWQGPVEVCIFITSEYLLNSTMSLVNKLRNMDANTKKFVTWHFMYPLRVFGPEYEHYVADSSFTGMKKAMEMSKSNTDSTTFEEDLRLMKELSFKMGLKGSTREHLSFYPHTVAMNVALKASKAMYFLSIDSDLTPSKNLRDKFIAFANKHNLFDDAQSYPPLSKVGRNRKDSDGVCFDHYAGSLPPPDVYVVPSFMTKDVEVSRTVKELRASIEAGNSTHFFAGLYEPSYSRTRHLDWLKQSVDAEDAGTECLYEVEYQPEYEPFVITRKSIPVYDERFDGYSPVENHHKRLLGILGYKFKVLQNVFLIHTGWKYISSVTDQKNKEQRFHRKDWSAFLNELSKLSKQNVYTGFLK